MIISASRRTDIPAFYSKWFINRVKAGYCAVPNPFNRDQVTFVSLKPQDVDVVVFWTRYPTPLVNDLHFLDECGLRYYFQYTLLANPREMDPRSPDVHSAIAAFSKLAAAIGPEHVIWRYDPIVFSNRTTREFHLRAFENIARQLRGKTNRCVVSVVDVYRKASKRLRDLAASGVVIDEPEAESLGPFMRTLVGLAGANGMEIQSCAEEMDLSPFGIAPGSCVDAEYIGRVFGLRVVQKKDPSQRKECRCVFSRDIGMYDSCAFGCSYCYATSSFDRARVNLSKHDPNSPSLLGWFDSVPPAQRDLPFD